MTEVETEYLDGKGKQHSEFVESCRAIVAHASGTHKTNAVELLNMSTMRMFYRIGKVARLLTE
ncbi:unnamed protein product [Amoebophrya sp. A120]|nr:unnamed protein product [Amoebophrya sp. A120]|eukprot:GSA120T00021145001.1